MSMQNIKYHSMNIVSILIFSYICAATINQVIRSGYSEPEKSPGISSRSAESARQVNSSFHDYDIIVSSGFFRISEDGQAASNGGTAGIDDLLLMGTITGPAEIARAVIRSKNEKDSLIFRRWADVYGYRLVRISETAVYLKRDSMVHRLGLYDSTKKKKDTEGSSGKTGVREYERSVSRAELNQKVKNLNTVFRGLRARPERVNGKVTGFKIAHVENHNILYKLGARKGDIIKKVNNKKIMSTQDFYNALKSVQSESMINVELMRGGKPIRAEFSIKE